MLRSEPRGDAGEGIVVVGLAGETLCVRVPDDAGERRSLARTSRTDGADTPEVDSAGSEMLEIMTRS